MLTVVDFLKLYADSIEEGRPVPVEVKGEPVKVGQVRELTTIPGERFLVLEEVEPDLFLTVPMTSYLQLVNFKPYPIVFEFPSGLRLATLPVWDYLGKELIERFSLVIGHVKEDNLKKVKVWLEEVKNIDLPWYTRKFLKLNSKIWAKLSLFSILEKLEEVEEEKPMPKVIKLTQDSRERLKNPYSLALAAHARYQKGKNFYVVFDEKQTRVYLPLDMIGKRIKVSVGDVVLFEGELDSHVLVIEENLTGYGAEDINVVEL
jgi:hypothetical protein